MAVLGGALITLQGVANSRISEDIGTWQAAALTQFTGFVVALLLALFVVRAKGWSGYKKVHPLYLSGGALAAFIIFGNVTAIHLSGVTLSVSAILLAQLGVAFFTDAFGWFGLIRIRMQTAHWVGIGLMAAGVVILGL